MKRLIPLALMVALGPLACSGDEEATGPSPVPSFEIEDGVHSGGNEHFFFLPPMVPAPAFGGVFNATRSPTVEICVVDEAANECAAPQPMDFPIRFTMDDGRGSETVRVSTEDEHYIVNWHTDQPALIPGAIYRIHVVELAGVLGFADVVVGSNKELKNGGTGQFIALTSGRTLPIKFRIEEGLPFVVDENGGAISAAGGDVVVEVPAGAVSETEPVPVTVEEVPPEDETLPEGTDVLPGTVFDFGPEGTEFAEPVGITVAYDPAIVPAGVPEEGLRLFTLVDGRWELLLDGSVNIEANTVTGFTDHFSTFGTLSISVFCSTVFDGITSFETFAEAFDAVIPGGTIEVCDGTHVVEGVVIDAPVTIQPQAGAAPVIQNNADSASFVINGVSVGIVQFLNLGFHNQSPTIDTRTFSIRAQGTYDQVIVDSSTFTVSSGGFASARAGASTVPGARLSVQNSAFTGGNRALGSGGGTLDVIDNMFNDQTDRALQFSSGSGLVQGNVMTNCGGLACIRPFQSDITVIGNTITGVGQSTALFSSSSNVVFTDNIVSGDFTFSAVQLQGQSTGRVEGNTISGCGPRGCLRVFGGNVDFINNQLADATTDVDPFNHNLILFASGATGRIEGNTIDGCGVGSCILVIGGAVVYVVANDITIYEAHGTRFGIDGFGGIDPNDPASTPPTLFIEDNTIVGVGGTSETDPNNPSAYAIKESGIKIENGTATVFRNSVSNANSGFLAVNGGTFTDGSDNVLDQVLTGVASFNQSAATVHSSDFTNYRIALEGEFGAGSLTCNWWGSVLGPVNTQGVNQNAFTPWATEPVAGTSATECSGGLP